MAYLREIVFINQKTGETKIVKNGDASYAWLSLIPFIGNILFFYYVISRDSFSTALEYFVITLGIGVILDLIGIFLSLLLNVRRFNKVGFVQLFGSY